MVLRFAFRVVLLLGMACALTVQAATFVDRLTEEQKRKMGLDQLSPEQLAALNQAVEQYRTEGATVAAESAATQAVEEYRKKEEPGMIARALDVFKRKQDESRQERITAIIPGSFQGWDGATLFRLDNGQVWRQSRPDIYTPKKKSDVPVVVYKSPSGYWRLRVLDDEGAWVTVVRVK